MFFGLPFEVTIPRNRIWLMFWIILIVLKNQYGCKHFLNRLVMFSGFCIYLNVKMEKRKKEKKILDRKNISDS